MNVSAAVVADRVYLVSRSVSDVLLLLYKMTPNLGPLRVALFLVLFAYMTRAVDENDHTGNEASHCAYVDNPVSTELHSGELTVGIIEEIRVVSASAQASTNGTEWCTKERESCYTLWFIDPVNKSKITMLKQGCWINPGKNDCTASECIASQPLSNEKIRNTTRFCCCLGNMCNVNVTDVVNFTAADIIKSQSAVSSHYVDPFYKVRTVIISLTSVFVCALIAVAVFTIIRCCFGPISQSGDAETGVFLVGGDQSKSGSGGGLFHIDLDDLKLDDVIHRGRYGEVHRGLLNDMAVAVKILYAAQRQYYYNEKDVFALPHMQHRSIVEFLGGKERAAGAEGPAQFLIITSYVPLGTLSNYLKNNTIDWFTFCRLSLSTVAGIAHLHTEINSGDRVKPTIAHRDINSRNILVRDDLTCCICDFGFAMKIITSRLMDSASSADDVEEHASLADVGTLRYMAPEVLEGSVNLYDCKSSLTQVDIYAFGLVLWEIGMRCNDLYQGLPTPEYQLPFEKEVGLHPSLEEMQVLVAKNRKRPTFPDTWKDTNQAIKAMKDTIEECWDQDAEARISAVCVEERTREMAMFWENRLKHVTPTSNFGQHLKDLEQRTDVQHNFSSGGSVSDVHDSNHTTESRVMDPVTQSNNVIITDENSLSTATVETMLSPADAGPAPLTVPSARKPDCNVVFVQTSAPVRAYRGLNPTAERNTHRDSDEELAIEGNTLINKPNTVAPASRVSHRIPYTQNVVDDDETQTLSEPTVVRPKKQNIPSNGGVDHLISKVPTTQEEDKRLSRLGCQLKKLGKFALPYFNWNGLKGVGGGGSGVGTDAKKSMLAPSSVEAGNTDNASRPVSSEVLLVNGTTVIRPTSLPLNSHISPHRMSNGVGRQPTTGRSNVTAPVDQNLPRSGTTFESIHQRGSALEEHVESLEMIKSSNVGAAGAGERGRGGGESEPPVMMMTVMGAGGGERATPIMDTTDITVGSSGSGSPHAESSTDISSSSEIGGVVPYRENLAPPSVDVIGTQSCDNYGFEVSRSPRAGQAACVV